jgi:two-component system, NarL family, nitrate/nitrite response regulator NarL
MVGAPPERPRALIADAAAPVRTGLRVALERDGFVIVAEAATAGIAVREALRLRPDVCVMDILLPGDGRSAVRAIKADVPRTTVVVLTGSEDREDLLGALRAGASGYLPKTTNLTRLPLAIRAALAGEAAIPRGLVMHIVDELRKSTAETQSMLAQAREHGLTPRECHVLILLARDLSTREIARHLGVADVTVRRHLSAIRRKLAVADRSAAIRELERWGATARDRAGSARAAP